MPQNSTVKAKKIEQPENHYQSPTEVAKDETLTKEEKKSALNTWEQDARQLLIASNEGMPMPEGLDHRLGEVKRAKEKIDGPRKHKPAH
ncbi:MAG TPA: hypothetical protein VK148_11275 [Xanthobacteraceae bacterium]|jgi:hypothetical protein|nr:hypothetical protein [Xanthobacteraceae bacterium]